MRGREFGLECQKLTSGFDYLRVGRLREVDCRDGVLHDYLKLSSFLEQVRLNSFRLPNSCLISSSSDSANLKAWLGEVSSHSSRKQEKISCKFSLSAGLSKPSLIRF